MEEKKQTKEEPGQMEERTLSVFASERKEDTIAMIIAFILSFIVVILFK